MKIGILTHPLETNYGGVLQAFAMQKVLRNLGHEAITIDRHNHEQYKSLFFHVLSYGKRLRDYYLYNRNVSPKWNPFLAEEEKELISQNFLDFINRNIATTEKCYPEDLYTIDEKYQFDAYVVGSDQVWLPGYCLNAFLDFVNRDGVVRISYAASSGAKSFIDYPSLLEKCKELAKNFSALSAREKSLAERVQASLDLKVSTVIDPTFLLDKSDYLRAVINSSEKSPIIFSYILDPSPEKQDFLSLLSNKLNLPVINGNVAEYYMHGGRNKLENCIFPSVDDWINNLSRARFVVTDSFHGTALSVLFNKQFVTLINSSRGKSRFLSLFEMLNIPTSHLLENISGFSECLLEGIDYGDINKNIMTQRELAFTFLESYLK